MNGAKVKAGINSIRRAAALWAGVLLVFGLAVSLFFPLNASAKSSAGPKLVMVAGSDSLFANIIDAYNQLKEEGWNVRLSLYGSESLNVPEKVEEIKGQLVDADVFLLQMIGGQHLPAVKSILDAMPRDWTCAVLSCGCDLADARVVSGEDAALQAYINNSSPENMRRMLLYLLSRYGGLAYGGDLAPVAIPSWVIYHPEAALNLAPKPDVEAVYNCVYASVSGFSDAVAAGLAVSTVHRAVYDAVYASGQDTVRPAFIDTVREAVWDAVYRDGQSNVSAAGARSLYALVYETIAGDPNLNTVYDTVKDAVYGCALQGENTGLAADVDAVYRALHDAWHADLGPGLGQYVDTVARAVYEALYPLLPPDDRGPDFDPLYRSVYGAVYGAAEKGGGELPGTFTSLRNYRAWYSLSGRAKEGVPWIGIVATNYDLNNADTALQEALLLSLERGGYNVILVYSDSNRKKAVEQFFMRGNQSAVDLLITASVGFNFIYGSPEAGVELFKKLNVPVMAPVYAYASLNNWENSPAGIAGEVYWSVAYPELDGRIEPVFMGGSKVVYTDEGTGTQITKRVPLDDRIARLAGRAISWAKLRKKDNAHKKIAVVYYNHYGGKDDIGASYLNLFASLSQVLQALKDEGYEVGDGDLNAAALEELVMKKGRNIGTWAPGELENLVRAGVLTIPKGEYLSWYSGLPLKLREQVEAEWGPPPGDIMVYEGKLVIPGAFLGNIFIGPQPLRGWCDGSEEDIVRRIHSGVLPPPHQYIAFYLWLQNGWKADAVVHLGTHGTLEWLPGRSVGLGGDDWPDVLIGNLPDIYPYIVNNPGEGTQAKRRGYAVIIDHLIPPVVQPGLYGELEELSQLVSDYREAVESGNQERAARLKELIVEKAAASGIDRDLGIDLAGGDFSRAISLLHEYLEELATELMPYGLHTLGQPPLGELLDQMVSSIVNYDCAARAGSSGQVRENLLLTTNEIKNLIRALAGEFIEPGPGRDPVRFPDALPTGRNFVSFDPRKVPDRAAWKIGREAADQLLTRYYDENGRYPETVGVVLWAIETMCTQGETVGLIFRLIGVEPVYDASGRVTKVKVTPLAELLDKKGRPRPRVDVLVTISGLFRDTFAYTVSLLDDAFRLVAQLDESPQGNLVKKHCEEVAAGLVKTGVSPDRAAELAAARIFGEPPGTYGTGVSDMVKATSAWNSTQDLIETYQARMSYIYGKNIYGEQALDVFRQMLSTVEAVTQVRDSLYGVLDNDDVYQYLGGLKMAAEAESGRPVSAYIVNTRSASDSSKVKVESFSEFVGAELRTRLLNSKWIEGMLKEGFSGSRAIGDHVANLFGVAATLGGVSDWAWQQVVNIFVFDENVRAQLRPYHLQAIAGWALEAARRDMWRADQETLQKLSGAYIQSAVQYGVVCCHHTCANLVFNEWIANYTAVDRDTWNSFRQAFEAATKKMLADIVKPPDNVPPSQPVPASKSSGSARTVHLPKEPAAPQPAGQPPVTPLPDEVAPPVTPPGTPGQEAKEGHERVERPGEEPEKPAAEQHEQGAGEAGERVMEAALQEGGGPGEGEKTAKTAFRSYEVEVKKEKQLPSPGRRAVAAAAVLVALGVVAVFIKGYLTGRR